MIHTRHLIWVFIAACATPMSAMREDNRRLTQTVTTLRADRRAQDRKIRDLEHQLALAHDKTISESPLPQLPVEVVTPATSPSGERVVGIADDGGEVIYEGDAAAGKAATLDDVSPRRAPRMGSAASAAEPLPVVTDRIEVTHHLSARPTRPHARDVAPPPAANSDAAGEYRAAVELVKGGKQVEAIAALRAFLQHYPRHDYADNAQYWLGEAFYAQKDYQHALVEFRATIETYPRGNKVPDALLKVGYCYQSLGQSDKARAVLEQVVSLYPKTEPAALAAKRLETP